MGGREEAIRDHCVHGRGVMYQRTHHIYKKIMSFHKTSSVLYIMSLVAVKVISLKAVANIFLLIHFLTYLVEIKSTLRQDKYQEQRDPGFFFNKLGILGYKEYFKLIEENYARNYAVILDDVKRNMHICG